MATFFNILNNINMAIYLREDRRTDWCPDPVEERLGKTLINPGHRDPEGQFIGTVNSTARMLNFLSFQKINEEEFKGGLSANAKSLGISEELLLELAEETLDQQRSNQKDNIK